jgi:hypothetical protein
VTNAIVTPGPEYPSALAGYFRSGYLSDIAWLPVLEESYFRNNADLGTGLLMANLAITSPHFFLPRTPRISALFLQITNLLALFPHHSNYAYLRFIPPRKSRKVKNALESVH